MVDARSADLGARFTAAGVIPVVTLKDARKAVPLAKALVAGGITMLEIVLRTPAALDAVRAITAEAPECDVGVGTVRSPDDMEMAARAGATFSVCPGFSPQLLEAGRKAAIPFVPAVATPAEVLQATEAGYLLLKLFPAELVGGPEMLRLLKGPFPEARFCCTGGIDLSRLAGFRAESNVAAVGGSFATPAKAIDEGAWSRITALAMAARRRWNNLPGELASRPVGTQSHAPQTSRTSPMVLDLRH